MSKSKSPTKPTTKLTWLPKKTFELEFTIPWKKAKEAYDKVLKETASKTTIKGFRKGKASLDLVEKSLDKESLYQEVIKRLLPETYQGAVKKHKLNPIISPKIQVTSLKKGQDWKFKATSCESPEVKLGNYQQAVKAELTKTKIWTPDKGKPSKKEDKEQSADQKMKITTQTLLNDIKVEIPDILIEDEVNRMLSRLLDQVNALGMTIDQYLASRKMTKEQLKNTYKKQAQETIKLELILQTIVRDRKITIEEKEIDQMIQATPDEKLRQKLNTPLQRVYIASILSKRKAIDYLINL